MRQLIVTGLVSLGGYDAMPRTSSPPPSSTTTTAGRRPSCAPSPTPGWWDRYHPLVFPLLLGAGKRPWSDVDRDKTMLDVVESQSYANVASARARLTRRS